MPSFKKTRSVIGRLEGGGNGKPRLMGKVVKIKVHVGGEEGGGMVNLD